MTFNKNKPLDAVISLGDFSGYKKRSAAVRSQPWANSKYTPPMQSDTLWELRSRTVYLQAIPMQVLPPSHYSSQLSKPWFEVVAAPSLEWGRVGRGLE